MTFVLLAVVVGIVLLLSSLGTRARHAGPGAYRLLLGPALIVASLITLPFVLLSRLLLGLGVVVMLIGALGKVLSRGVRLIHSRRDFE